MRKHFFGRPRRLYRLLPPGAALRQRGALLVGWGVLLLLWPDLLAALAGIAASAAGAFVLTLAWHWWAARDNTGAGWPREQRLVRPRSLPLRSRGAQRRQRRR